MNKRETKKTAFTLAEVVITLIVIGIVSAITIPMLNNDVNDKKWNVARQKAQATIGEAFKLITINGEIDKTLSTQEFVEKVIPKYLKLAKTCTVSNAKDCGMSTAANFYKTPTGTKVQLPTTWTDSTSGRVVSNSPEADGVWATRVIYNHASPNTNSSYMFKTLDGFSVNFFYNPYCAVDTKDKYSWKDWSSSEYPVYNQESLDVICLMGVYDMNGIKGPNKVGLDVGFVGSFYNGYQARAIATQPHTNIDQSISRLPRKGSDYIGAAINYCKNLGKEYEWILSSQDELSLLFLNQKLVWNTTSSLYRWYYTRQEAIACAKYYGVKAHLHVGFSDGRYGNRSCAVDSVTYASNNYSICVRNNTLK